MQVKTGSPVIQHYASLKVLPRSIRQFQQASAICFADAGGRFDFDAPDFVAILNDDIHFNPVLVAVVVEAWRALQTIAHGNELLQHEALQPWLTRAFDLARQRRLQLVLASHHPEVINYAAAEGAWLFERPGGGPAGARRLEVDLEAGQTADEALREALA